MAIGFRCTGCGHAFRVHDHLTGKRIKCARCGASLVVPSESTRESQNATWNDHAAGDHGPTPVAAAAPAPPRPPVQTSGYFAPVEGAKLLACRGSRGDRQPRNTAGAAVAECRFSVGLRYFLALRPASS